MGRSRVVHADMKPKTERRARFDSMMNTPKRQEVSI